jgi:hypothetical protein
MSHPTINGDRGPTSEQGIWDFLSFHSDEQSSHSSDSVAALGDLDSHPSGEVTQYLDERDDILHRLASFDSQVDLNSDEYDFSNLSSEEIISQGEAYADFPRLLEENLANRVYYDELRVSHHQLNILIISY